MQFLQLPVHGCSTASRRMGLYSGSINTEQSILPSLTANNEAKSKQEGKVAANKNGVRQKKKNDDRMFVSFPEVAKTIQVTTKASKLFARKSPSTLKTSQQTEDMSKNRQFATNNYFVRKKRSGKVRLPPLVVAPAAERVVSEESWSAALGLRDSYEIPRKVFSRLTDEILKIDRQMKEEATVRRIREKRISFDDKKKELSPWEISAFERTSRPGFSYFPSLKKSVGELPESNDLLWMENLKTDRMFREERSIQRKMKEFKNRHQSHFHNLPDDS